MMSELSINNGFESINEFAFITGLLCDIELLLGIPIKEIMKTMPLDAKIEQALIKQSGKLGELLKLTIAYLSASDEVTNELINHYNLDKQTLHQEFINASQWCSDLGI